MPYFDIPVAFTVQGETPEDAAGVLVDRIEAVSSLWARSRGLSQRPFQDTATFDSWIEPNFGVRLPPGTKREDYADYRLLFVPDRHWEAVSDFLMDLQRGDPGWVAG